MANVSALLTQVLFRLKDWKNKLIDLSFRNPFLNFKPRRKTTIHVIDELPSEVFRLLQVNGNSMSFLPVDRLPNTVSLAEGEDNIGDLERSVEFSSYDRSLLSSHHIDSYLQTDLPSEKLEASLIAVQRDARTWIEERGINALFLSLGMLNYFEAENSQVLFRAPILMLPVELHRKGASTKFLLKSSGDDPILNPALVRKLASDFGISLPNLPEKYDDAFDPQDFFVQIQKAISAQPRWKITNGIYLSFFSFQKYLMYKDIEENENFYVQHEVIQALAAPDLKKAEQIPESIERADLDTVLLPKTTFFVLDSDSTQQKAILAVRSGANLVIEGPPGTGKSQTIANIIADALSQGKSVLFVSEKKAALDVVFNRLKNVGLHDFCLELHSHKTNKRTVLNEIARVLDSQIQKDHSNDSGLERLLELRTDLNAYVYELHEPLGVLALTPHQVMGRVCMLEAMPHVQANIPNLEEITREELEKTCLLLKEHTELLEEIGDPKKHPWRGSGLQNVSMKQIDEMSDMCQTASRILNDLVEKTWLLATELGSVVPETFGKMELLCELALTLSRSPTADESILKNPKWNTVPAAAADLMNHGRSYALHSQKALAHFKPTAFQSSVDDLSQLVERIKLHYQSLLRFFRIQFWKDRGLIRSHFLDKYNPHKRQLIEDLGDLLIAVKDFHFLQTNDAMGTDLFGSHWNGPNSDWDALERFSEWVVNMRKYLLDDLLSAKGMNLAASAAFAPEKATSSVEAIRKNSTPFFQIVQRIGMSGAFTEEGNLAVTASTRISDTAVRLAELKANAPKLRIWSLYQENLQKCLSSVAGDYLLRFTTGSYAVGSLESSFRKLFYRRWLDFAFRQRPGLGAFRAKVHDAKIGEFRELDQQWLSLARDRLTHRLKDRYNQLLVDETLTQQQKMLHTQIRLKRVRQTLRQIFKQTFNAIRVIKPCFMMSPLSVAQFLDPTQFIFDLVVFDEASQVTPEDALCAIVRGKQIVIVGDPKQLPPTNFFAKQIYDDLSSSEFDQETPVFEDLESILDEFAKNYPRRSLEWHYRSRHESLIAFSNAHFYQNRLITFASADTDTSERGLQFQYVGGVYEGKGQNRREAEAVLEAVCRHIREYPQLSLGIGTFGLRQAELMTDLIENKRREDPSIDSFFDSQEEPFFVKNLETIQGDERDVIFISVTYGPSSEGVIRYNFGPLSGEHGGRRLNVLITRAKLRLTVFSSMHGDQIDVARAKSEGARLLREFLIFSETGKINKAAVNDLATTESVFEDAVYEELTGRGIRLMPQVGQSGYRIDFGVIDDEFPGKFIAGIECDGYSYHHSSTARDRDRLRHQVLKSLGWRIYRLWSIDWFHDKEEQLKRIMNFIQESRRAYVQDKIRREASADIIQKPITPKEETSLATADGAGNTSVKDISLSPYKFTPIQILGSPEDFYANETDLPRVALKVIKIESPVHINEAAKRIIAHWRINRVGNKIFEKINSVCKYLEKCGVILINNEYLFDKERPEVVPRFRGNSIEVFNPDHICPEEFKSAVKLILGHCGARMQAELARDVARIMGFERTGDKLNQKVFDAIQKLLDERQLRIVSNGLRLVE